MVFWKKLKTKFKSLLSVSLIAAVLSQLIIPAAISEAAAPRFNFLSGDQKLLRGVNISNNETVWQNNINGAPNDVFEGLIYYHNGEVDTVANNTKVKVSFPSATTSNQAVISASILADNADTVSDNMTLTLSENATIEFVPGSVIWYPNQNQQPGTSSPLPFGQTGNEIVSAGGVNLGDIQGCWEYAGFVKFRFKTMAIQPAQIIKSKVVKDLTTSAEGIDIQANPGDEILYTLTTKNTGGSAEAVTVADDISDILEYADFVTASDSGVLSQSQLTWLPITLNPGETVLNTFKVKVKNPLPNDPQNGYHFDFIMYNIYGNGVFVRLVKPTPAAPSLTVKKMVRDFTTGEMTFVKTNEINAGDTLEYKIDFANTGDGNADGVILSDVLPANVTYLPGSTILSMNDEMERTFIDGVTQSGLSINIAAKSHGYIKFKVAASASIAGGEILTNTTYLKLADKTISDSATSKIKKAVVVAPITPVLPKTGAETLILGTMLALVIGIYFIYRERKKRLAQILAS